MDQLVELDRKILDYIVGLDTEMNDLVEGSDLYTPQVSFDDVVLPKEKKELIQSTIRNYERSDSFLAF